MRFFSYALSGLALIAGLVSAQSNPIISPSNGEAVVAGTSIPITWTPTTSGEITLRLRYGNSNDLSTGPPIATVPNSGSYTWQVPSNIGNGEWAIAITSGSNVNYSPRFTVSGGTGKQGDEGTPSKVVTTATAKTTTTAHSNNTTMTTTTDDKSSVSTSTSVSTTGASTLTTSAASTSGDSSATATQSGGSGAPSSGAAVAGRGSGGSVAAVMGLAALVVLV